MAGLKGGRIQDYYYYYYYACYWVLTLLFDNADTEGWSMQISAFTIPLNRVFS